MQCGEPHCTIYKTHAPKKVSKISYRTHDLYEGSEEQS
jgi:hypothetical protein